MTRLLGVLADSGPVVVLAAIAAAGSFTHIRDTAVEHGQGGWMAWAVAVCIDLTCVMAARERQRDKRTGRATGRLSWPTLVMVGGILLSLAANLAQAEPSAWGWITAATPAGAFLVAVSMLERRAAGAGTRARTVPAVLSAPPSFGRPSSSGSFSSGSFSSGSSAPSSSASPVSSSSSSEPFASSSSSSSDSTGDGTPRPGLAVVGAPRPHHDDQDNNQDDDQGGGQTALPVPSADRRGGSSAGAGPLLEFARRVAAEHQATHGRPITRDALRARLGVSNQLASDLLRQIRNHNAA